VYLKIRITH